MKIRVKPSTDHLMSFVHFHSQHWERKKGQRNTEMHRSFFSYRWEKILWLFLLPFFSPPYQTSTVCLFYWIMKLILSTTNHFAYFCLEHFIHWIWCYWFISVEPDRGMVCDLWPIKNSTLILLEDNTIVSRK